MVRHRTALPVRGGADGVAAVLLFVDQYAAQFSTGVALGSAPGITFTGRQFQCTHGIDQALRTGHPGEVKRSRAVQGPLVSKVRCLRDDDGPGAGGQLFKAAGDGRQRGVVTHEQVPVVVERDDERAARPADAHLLPRLGLRRPGSSRGRR